jgi:nucleoside-diphosphate-sugar epimerase
MSAINQNNSRTILVTGAAGFVGTHLCRTLKQHGWDVLATSRGGDDGYSLTGIRTVKLELLYESERWRAAMQSCHGIVHLAAYAHKTGSDGRLQSEFDRVNLEGSRFVMQHAVSARVPRFIFLSSIKVNGEGGERPYRSTDVPDPQDAYGRSKWAAEKNLESLCARSDTSLIVIRPPLVYGPGVKANFRRLLHLAYWGVPLPFAAITNRRSLIGVQNLVDFIETCITHPAASQQTWLISDGEDLSTPELLDRLSRLMHRRARMFAISPVWMRAIARLFAMRDVTDRICGSLCLDSSAAQSSLGWRPPFSMNEELARTVAAYVAERKQ